MSAIGRGRRGVALPIAVITLALLGLVVVSAFEAALREHGSSRGLDQAEIAREAAESGIALTLDGWQASWNYLALGDSAVPPPLILQPGVEARVVIDRLTPVLFLLRSEGTVASAGLVTATRGVGELIQLPLPASVLAGWDTIPPPGLDSIRPAVIAEGHWVPLYR